jgi:hypothetical protein
MLSRREKIAISMLFTPLGLVLVWLAWVIYSTWGWGALSLVVGLFLWFVIAYGLLVSSD